MAGDNSTEPNSQSEQQNNQVDPNSKVKSALDGVNPDHLPPTPADSTPASDSPVESPVPDHRNNGEQEKQLPAVEQQMIIADS